MTRITMAAGAILLMAAGSALAQTSSEGQILCQQDLQKLQGQVQQRQASLTPAQQQNLRDRMKVANDQCMSSPSLAQTTIAQIRQDLTGQGTPQSAQTPGQHSTPGMPSSRTPD